MTLRPGRVIVSLVALVALASLALALRGSDLGHPPIWLPHCMFHKFTGLHCPGCGNTRAAYALLHADLAGALRQNVLFVLSLPFLGILFARTWLHWAAPGWLRPLRFHWRERDTWVIIAVLMSYWVVRNLPWTPFQLLAPKPIASLRENLDSLMLASPAPGIQQAQER